MTTIGRLAASWSPWPLPTVSTAVFIYFSMCMAHATGQAWLQGREPDNFQETDWHPVQSLAAPPDMEQKNLLHLFGFGDSFPTSPQVTTLRKYVQRRGI